MGHVGGRRFSVGELHAASKTSSANGSHLNVWDFDISAAEFPQQKKRASLVWIGPYTSVPLPPPPPLWPATTPWNPDIINYFHYMPTCHFCSGDKIINSRIQERIVTLKPIINPDRSYQTSHYVAPRPIADWMTHFIVIIYHVMNVLWPWLYKPSVNV